MRILYVEDEPNVASFVQKGLKSEGFEIDIAYDGMLGLRLFNTSSYDVVILDINLPKINGFDLCKEIKSVHPSQLVMLLTALDSIIDKETGFGAGADDYLAKPFEFRELVLRIHALARRKGPSLSANTVIQVDNLIMDTGSKIVTRDGKRIELTGREYALLEYLMKNAGKIVSRVDISERVWDIRFDTNTNVIDVFINYLRKKIDVGHSKKLLHTVVGMGYMLRG
ncbi:DNA-binding response regulator [Dyadobacter luteus]|jgi:DNA-binding response OmpR family regulator|uniref:DNA-binding response regulator n=1 Tax=Dyadobacter luteus TaxID=2259619 RepID=A0A3D8YF29_9BACT|nr:response regulator transcription factor [Dyadobacter luteus]REA62815.1 DNA-binding response regulator [Dyadobacter luteus]